MNLMIALLIAINMEVISRYLRMILLDALY
nr:MAG TPA: hypothetical protein [Caudoviricetes sp.]